MDRLERVRRVVDDIIRQQADEQERQVGFVHLYGVSQACALLALKRGLDVQLCAVAGMLHDISTYKTGDPTDHGRRSAIEAERLLGGLGAFAEPEIAVICRAISRHSAKDEVDGPLGELLKDADVLQHYLYNPGFTFTPAPKERSRLEAILGELGVHAVTRATHGKS
jgi:uncharacterized protein